MYDPGRSVPTTIHLFRARDSFQCATGSKRCLPALLGLHKISQNVSEEDRENDVLPVVAMMLRTSENKYCQHCKATMARTNSKIPIGCALFQVPKRFQVPFVGCQPSIAALGKGILLELRRHIDIKLTKAESCSFSWTENGRKLRILWFPGLFERCRAKLPGRWFSSGFPH